MSDDCAACGRPFSPTHDPEAPGMKVRHVFRTEDPPPGKPVAGWAAAGCMIGSPVKRCGRQVFGAMAVLTLDDVVEHLHEPPRPGVALLCQEHFDGLTGAWVGGA